MAAGAGTQQSLRKALKTVGLAKANGDFKVLDVAIAKATNHDEVLPKEKHVITILNAVSASRPRAEAAYCIHGLARRLSKTYNWKVALKTVIVIHRALREVDESFCDALVKYSWSRGHMLSLSHLWDESSQSALGNSSWVRTYASYLEERLECFRILKYDVQKDHSRTKELDTPQLLRQLPALQQLLSRLLHCQPADGSLCNCLVQYGLSMVAGESAKLYAAITDGIVNLLDKFFEMQQDDAAKALEIYKKSRSQEERLSHFFEICRSFSFGRALKLIKIQQPPASFLITMEDYVKEAPCSSMLTKMNGGQDAAPKGVSLVGDLLIDHKPDENVEGKSNPDGTVPEAPSEAAATPQILDLLSFDEINPATSESDEKNSLALAIVQTENPSDGLNSTDAESSWEVALFAAPSSNLAAITAPSSNVPSVEETELGVGLDRMTLDRLYDGAMAATPNQDGFFHRQSPSNPFEDIDPYQLVSLPPTSMQLAIMPQQHEQMAILPQQHEQMAIVPHQHEQMATMPQQTIPYPVYGSYGNGIATQMPFMTQQQQAFMMQQQQQQPQAFMMQQQQQQPLANISHTPTNSSGNPFAI